MVVKRNSMQFKELEIIVKKFAKDKNRKRRIKLFSLKAGEDISKRIDVAKKADSEVIYNLYYQMLLDFFKSDYTLRSSDEKAGLFYFVTGGVVYLPFEISRTLFKIT